MPISSVCVIFFVLNSSFYKEPHGHAFAPLSPVRQLNVFHSTSKAYHPASFVGRARARAMRSLAAAVLLVASATASEVPATTLGRPSVPPSGMRTAAAAVRLKPASQLCTEEAKRAEPGGELRPGFRDSVTPLETCAQVRHTGLEPQSSRPQAASSATHECEPRLGQGFERGVPCKTLYRTHSCCSTPHDRTPVDILQPIEPRSSRRVPTQACCSHV